MNYFVLRFHDIRRATVAQRRSGDQPANRNIIIQAVSLDAARHLAADYLARESSLALLAVEPHAA